MGGFVAFVGFVAIVLGIVAAIKGSLPRFRLQKRKQAVGVIAAGFLVFVTGAAMSAPKQGGPAPAAGQSIARSVTPEPTASPSDAPVEPAAPAPTTEAPVEAVASPVAPTASPAPPKARAAAVAPAPPVAPPAPRVAPAPQPPAPAAQPAAPVEPPPAAAGPQAPAPQAPPSQDSASCGDGYYRNVDGNCISRPVQSDEQPAGATAQCRDGSYSFSQNRQGTCSGHGGVARWL